MARTKVATRECKYHGTHPMSTDDWYAYPLNVPLAERTLWICKIHEADRQKMRHAKAKAVAEAESIAKQAAAKPARKVAAKTTAKTTAKKATAKKTTARKLVAVK